MMKLIWMTDARECSHVLRLLSYTVGLTEESRAMLLGASRNVSDRDLELACEKRKFQGPLSVNQQLEPNRPFSCCGIVSNVLRVSAALNHDDDIPGWFQEFHDDQRGLIVLLLQVRVVMGLEFAVVVLA